MMNTDKLRKLDDINSIIRAASLTGELQAMVEFVSRLEESDWKIRGDDRGNFLIETQGRTFRVNVEEIR